MDYRVVLARGKAREILIIPGCTCASEAEKKALQRHPGFSIFDISRCGESGFGRDKFTDDE